MSPVPNPGPPNACIQSTSRPLPSTQALLPMASAHSRGTSASKGRWIPASTAAGYSDNVLAMRRAASLSTRHVGEIPGAVTADEHEDAGRAERHERDAMSVEDHVALHVPAPVVEFPELLQGSYLRAGDAPVDVQQIAQRHKRLVAYEPFGRIGLLGGRVRDRGGHREGRDLACRGDVPCARAGGATIMHQPPQTRYEKGGAGGTHHGGLRDDGEHRESLRQCLARRRAVLAPALLAFSARRRSRA
jgi:hypothetical protein